MSRILGFYPNSEKMKVLQNAMPARKYKGTDKWTYYYKIFPFDNRLEFNFNRYFMMPFFMVLAKLAAYPFNYFVRKPEEKKAWVRPAWAERLTLLSDEEIRRIDREVELDYKRGAMERYVEEAPIREAKERERVEREDFWRNLQNEWEKERNDRDKPGPWEVRVYNELGFHVGFKDIFSGYVRDRRYN